MRIKTRSELIRAYIDFFKKKGHAVIPSASLIPENDPTVLFTTAGMHPLVPYLLGQRHPLGKRLVSVQKCVRTTDIDKVGNESHHTFFEMLGNWSLGDYWKKEAIEWSYEFLTKVLKIDKKKLTVSCFAGDKNALRDEESAKTWKSLGVKKIKFLGKDDNWWGPAGKTGPCGPDTEMFVDGVEIWNNVFMEYNKVGIKFILVDWINCLYDKERGLNRELAEILQKTEKKIIIVTNADINDINNKLGTYNFEVFSLNKNPDKSNINYFKKLLDKYNFKASEIIYFDHKTENVKSAESLNIKSIQYKNNNQIKKFIEDNEHIYEALKQKNVDTGMGVERTLAILNNLNDNYMTEVWKPIIDEIEHLSGKKYKGNEKTMRIIADHIKAAVFIIADGVIPSNVGQGYVLRRLLRRAIVKLRNLGFVGTDLINPIAEEVYKVYNDYEELQKNRKKIYEIINNEEEKFDSTLNRGLNILNKIISDKRSLSGKDAFLLFQSYGFPIEVTEEIASEKGIKVDKVGFEREFEKHQKLSRSAAKGRFSSGLADTSERTTRLHTATHLLNEALRRVLRKDIRQRGSNITAERLRFDFNFNRKLTADEIKRVEDLINEKIRVGLEVVREEMPLKDALKLGAQAEFGAKYPEIVSVYTVLDSKDGAWFSKEICTGPHVSNTREIGHFKIIKEEGVAAGVRRIKAVVG